MCIPHFDVNALNESMKKENQLVNELVGIGEIARQLGLNDEAIKYLVEEISASFEAGDPVQIYWCGTASKVPTQKTGKGSFYYWRMCGNAYFDVNSHVQEYEEPEGSDKWIGYGETWIKIRLAI